MKKYYKHIIIPNEKKLYSGFDAMTNSFIGIIKSKFINKRKLRVEAKKVHELSLEYSKLSDVDIDSKQYYYQKKLKLNNISNNEFLEAFAVVVELGFRTNKKRAYIVQIMGALSLVRNMIIEMSTGEGKTLTASLAGVIFGWKGKHVHILTSNDYLASRDTLSLTKFYNRANLSVGSITSETEPEDRKSIYEKSIVYSTAQQVLADFLKDRMKEEQKYDLNHFLINYLGKNTTLKDYVLRGLDTVIVDEADSVLADDAITPLIISATAENRILQESVVNAYNVSQRMIKDIHYIVYEKFHDITLTQEGEEFVEKNVYSLTQIWRSKERREFLIRQAISAKELFKLNEHYIIQEKKIVIVDEKTGRIMSDRTWSNGLHQAMEVKESLEITNPTTTFAKMSFQRFFRLYKQICGMSGTLTHLQNEFWQIYGVLTLKIPPRVPSKMQLLKDRIYYDNKAKQEDLVKYISEVHKKNLPILIGLTTIKDSLELESNLKELNLKCTLLNAISAKEEATIIESAGEFGKITIATNMAGRGTDIHISDNVNMLGGLQVITTQRDKSRRVDMQFFGRCARQGQNGKALSFLSLDDHIMQNYLSKYILYFLLKYFKFRLVQKLSVQIYIIYQNKIEKKISKMRNKTLLNEFSINDSMSYTK